MSEHFLLRTRSYIINAINIRSGLTKIVKARAREGNGSTAGGGEATMEEELIVAAKLSAKKDRKEGKEGNGGRAGRGRGHKKVTNRKMRAEKYGEKERRANEKEKEKARPKKEKSTPKKEKSRFSIEMGCKMRAEEQADPNGSN